MPSWQIAYHLIFFLVSLFAFVALRWTWSRRPGWILILLPPALAAAAEVIINLIWPEMLASSSTAGVGLVIAWMINTILGVVAGFLVLNYRRR